MTPTEDVESAIFAQFCRAQGLLFGHINNEMYTKSWKQKGRQTELGSAAGYPDYVIVVRAKQSVDGLAHLIHIEMKRQKGKRGGANGSVTSEKQKEWLEAINETGNFAHVAHGAVEAAEIINGFLKRKGKLL